MPTALTDCDVTTPGKLTVQALDEACREIGATMAFASPAALANVVATAAAGTATGVTSPGAGAGDHAGLAALRLVFSAGAPVPAETLHAIAALAPNASIRTPYGMTEALPVADIDLAAIDAAEADGDGRGVCVGRPVDGAEVRICPMGFDALDGVPDAVAAGETGEILVRAPWVSEGYLGRWETERLARPGGGWHRSGDVGHLDDDQQLWVEGRSVHVIDAAGGAITPVPVERAIERSLEPKRMVTAGRVAAVGVGPAGCQQLVVVIERPDGSPGLADHELAAAVRAVVARAGCGGTRQSRRSLSTSATTPRSTAAAVADWAADTLA